MELIILSMLVGILAVLQGWQMFSQKRNQHNNPGLGEKLDIIITKLILLERRLEDIWNKLEEK